MGVTQTSPRRDHAAKILLNGHTKGHQGKSTKRGDHFNAPATRSRVVVRKGT